MSVQPFLVGDGWMQMKDGDDSCRAIFDQHYSRYVYADGRKPKLFVGPGKKMVLMRADGRALFAWREFISGDGQQGVNCAIFRNEGDERASTLILEAEALARDRWPYIYRPSEGAADDGSRLSGVGLLLLQGWLVVLRCEQERENHH